MARCGCSGSVCSCLVTAGVNVAVTGAGTATNPYVISSTAGQPTVSDTATVDMNIVGQDISANVKLDPVAGNLIFATAQGIRVDCATIAAACDFATDFVVTDTTSVNLTLTGDGSNATPYNLSAQVILDPAGLITSGPGGLLLNCAAIRTCLSAGPGITYDPLTGLISAHISTDAGNGTTLGTDNGIYTPAGAATVSVACGLLGDGSPGDPLTTNTPAAWPYACTETLFGAPLYCGPDNVLRTGPRPMASVITNTQSTNLPLTALPAALATIDTATINLQNPSTCLPAVAFVTVEFDIGYNLVPASAIQYTNNGDGMVTLTNTGATNTNIVTNNIQTTRVFQFNLTPGQLLVFNDNLQARSFGAAGSTYNRTQWNVNAIIVTNG